MYMFMVMANVSSEVFVIVGIIMFFFWGEIVTSCLVKLKYFYNEINPEVAKKLAVLSIL